MMTQQNLNDLINAGESEVLAMLLALNHNSPHPSFSTKNFPCVPCIYYIWWHENCIYIGATKNLKDRMRKLHHKHPEYFTYKNSVTWDICPIHQLRQKEEEQIQKLQPCENKCMRSYYDCRNPIIEFSNRKEVK